FSRGPPVSGAGLQPQPFGAACHVCIGGEGLARGSLARPDLTAERFVPDPFGGEPGGRLYRTGDLARLLPDGNLHFLGRADQQIKIRGFRIEPGEIEAALTGHPAVREAAVVAREDEALGRRLVAYVAGDESLPAADDLRTFLARSLPEHMLPSLFIHLASLPRTLNGKVDRQALPAPGTAGADLQAPPPPL